MGLVMHVKQVLHRILKAHAGGQRVLQVFCEHAGDLNLAARHDLPRFAVRNLPARAFRI